MENLQIQKREVIQRDDNEDDVEDDDDDDDNEDDDDDDDDDHVERSVADRHLIRRMSPG